MTPPTAVDVPEVANRLLTAYRTGEPIAPVIEDHPNATMADAYHIQQEQVRHWTDAGQTIKGHKVGLTSAAMQEQMGVDQPDYGHLLSSMFHAEQQPVPAASFLQPRIEPEIAFVLGRPLSGPGITTADAIRAVEFVLPAVEIIDSRIRDWNISIVDTIADNASSAGVVLGSKPTLLSTVDLRSVGCTLYSGGEILAGGTGSAILGSPLNGLVWLANTLAGLGVSLEPGHVVLPGSITRAFPIGPGETMTATLSDLGSVTVTFDQTM